MAQTPDEKISAAGFPVYLRSFSAIDSYLGTGGGDAVYSSCTIDLAGLAKLFEGLRYPGTALADAAVDCMDDEGNREISNRKTWYFHCEETGAFSSRGATYEFLEFYRNCKTRRFYDTNGIYPRLRFLRDGEGFGDPECGKKSPLQWLAETEKYDDPLAALCELAVLLAKYFPDTPGKDLNIIAAEFRRPYLAPQAELQRLLLSGLLGAENPACGFELLKKCGFITACWPELAVLDDVDHSKEFHPEGNVWKHTMEALRYRKTRNFDLRLSLGLLLHDSGKALSKSSGSHRFDQHAELGERQTRRFLERLGFETALVSDVCFLVRNHMLPAALPRLPLIRTGDIMESRLFPLLLELYRCDESSSFKGLDNFYHSSAAYQAYLKYRRNPYRSAKTKIRK